MRSLLLFLAFSTSACLSSSRIPPRPMLPEKPMTGDAIVVCGRRFSIGAPVVLWNEGPHYDAYRPASGPSAAPGETPPPIARLDLGRVRKHADGTREVLLAAQSEDLEGLRAIVDQFVLHFDVCGVSSVCDRVLLERHLSVHFMLDLDGTLYQTADLRETCWHATKANSHSVGIEIANMGAYPPGRHSALDEWYACDTRGPYVNVPERLGEGGIRTPGFVARPARPERIRGRIQGDDLEQYDFTPEQYETLVKLAAALCRIFPRIAPDVPREILPDGDRLVLDRALDDAQYESFHGILGHYHVQTNKNDPGPAFDWERFLGLVRVELGMRMERECAASPSWQPAP